MAGAEPRLKVEVVYALPERQVLLAIEVEPGTTVHEAIRESGIDLHFPNLDVDNSAMGVFGKRVKPDTLVRDGDRIEIYRPLVADPKALRRARARKKS